VSQLKVLYFDVETIPAYERSEQWERGIEIPPPPVGATDEEVSFLERQHKERMMKRMALQPEACQMVGLNVIRGDDPPVSGWVGEPHKTTGIPLTESDLLTLFWNWAAQCPRLIGFNCLKFDLPVIYTRSALLGVQPTVAFYDVKPWDSKIIDLLQKRFGHSRDFMSLKALRRVLELPVPAKYDEVIDNTGADIEELYLKFISSDDPEALRLLKLYGELDVLTTKLLAQLWQKFFFCAIE